MVTATKPRKTRVVTAVFDPGPLTPDIQGDTDALIAWATMTKRFKRKSEGPEVRKAELQVAEDTVRSHIAAMLEAVAVSGRPVKVLTIRVDRDGNINVGPFSLRYKDGVKRGPLSADEKASRAKARAKHAKASGKSPKKAVKGK